MKKLLIFIALLVTAIVTGIYFFYADPDIIDENYISSQKFQTLEDDFKKNKAEYRSQEWILGRVALQLLADSSQYSHPLPIRIDSLAVDSILALKNAISLKEIKSQRNSFDNYNWHGVLVLGKKSMNSVIFLMNRKGLYKEVDVILATVNDSSIIDFESIGSYGKNLSEETVSLIQIKKNKTIKTKVIKKRFYPVQHKNTVNYKYAIMADGTINAEVSSDS